MENGPSADAGRGGEDRRGLAGPLPPGHQAEIGWFSFFYFIFPKPFPNRNLIANKFSPKQQA